MTDPITLSRGALAAWGWGHLLLGVLIGISWVQLWRAVDLLTANLLSRLERHFQRPPSEEDAPSPNAPRVPHPAPPTRVPHR